MKRSRRSDLIAAIALLVFIGGLAWFAAVRMRHERQNRALIQAVLKDETATVHSLLDSGASANARQDQAHNHFGLMGFLQNLLGRESERDQTALQLAVLCRNSAIVRALLEHGANPNVKDPSGETPLIATVRYGDMESAKALLDHGADANARQMRNSTSLMIASAYGHKEIVTLLLAHGAQINARNSYNRTALGYAAEERQDDTITLLKQVGGTR